MYLLVLGCEVAGLLFGDRGLTLCLPHGGQLTVPSTSILEGDTEAFHLGLELAILLLAA